MPVITLTPADKLQSLKVEVGPHKAVMSKVEGPKPSSSGKGVNFFIEFTLTEGKYNGKIITIASSSGTRETSVLGNMQWWHKNVFGLIKAAITDTKMDDKEEHIDTDTLLNQPLDIVVGAETPDGGGSLFNIITGFAPAGKGGASPF